MTFHVLNGDAMRERFERSGITGEVCIMRECLTDGPSYAKSYEDFFALRADFIQQHFNASNYDEFVAGEIKKLQGASGDTEINLWFGYDLFCQANLWFLISYIHHLAISKKIFVVYPSYLSFEHRWEDFGGATEGNLKYALQHRKKLQDADVLLAVELWTAFSKNDLPALTRLATSASPVFPFLSEVCQAHVERFSQVSRPRRAVQSLVDIHGADFPRVFQAFSRQEGVYGFGDTQVREIFDDVVNEL